MREDLIALVCGTAFLCFAGGAVFYALLSFFGSDQRLRRQLRARLPRAAVKSTASTLQRVGEWLERRPATMGILGLFVAFQSAFDSKQEEALRSALYTGEHKTSGSVHSFRVESAVLALAISSGCLVLAILIKPSGLFILAALAAQLVVPYARIQHIQKKKETFRRICENQLTDMLSLMVLIVKAGSTFDASLNRYASSFDTELAKEIRKLHDAYTSGMQTRTRALDGFARSIDSEPIYWFVASVKRSLLSGGSLSKALETQLHEMRTYRRERIEEEIAKKPVKLLIPLGLFILPAMLILLLGPVLMEVMSGIQTGY